jgi:hypothetical protein
MEVAYKSTSEEQPWLSLKETLQGTKLTYTKPKKAQAGKGMAREVGEEATRQSCLGKAKPKRKPKVGDC